MKNGKSHNLYLYLFYFYNMKLTSLIPLKYLFMIIVREMCLPDNERILNATNIPFDCWIWGARKVVDKQGGADDELEERDAELDLSPESESFCFPCAPT